MWMPFSCGILENVNLFYFQVYLTTDRLVCVCLHQTKKVLVKKFVYKVRTEIRFFICINFLKKLITGTLFFVGVNFHQCHR